jgi:hypothetical protein
MENDERILKLREKIEEKKASLGKAQRFLPSTNCIIDINGSGASANINTMTKEKLVDLMVKLNSLFMSAKELGVADMYEISGFNVEDWIGDIQLKLSLLSRAEEERALKSMENTLTALLSERKKVELEIDEIESLLGE